MCPGVPHELQRGSALLLAIGVSPIPLRIDDVLALSFDLVLTGVELSTHSKKPHWFSLDLGHVRNSRPGFSSVLDVLLVCQRYFH